MDPVRQDDRDHALTQLRDAVGRGGIDLAEFEHRSAMLTSVATRTELDALVADLTMDQTSVQSSEPGQWREYAGEWRWWLAGALVLTAVWGFQGVTDGELDQFWPAVPLGVWAAVLLAILVIPADSDR